MRWTSGEGSLRGFVKAEAWRLKGALSIPCAYRASRQTPCPAVQQVLCKIQTQSLPWDIGKEATKSSGGAWGRASTGRG